MDERNHRSGGDTPRCDQKRYKLGGLLWAKVVEAPDGEGVKATGPLSKVEDDILGTIPNIEHMSEYLTNMCFNCKPQHVIPINRRQCKKDLRETHVYQTVVIFFSS